MPNDFMDFNFQKIFAFQVLAFARMDSLNELADYTYKYSMTVKKSIKITSSTFRWPKNFRL